MKKFTKKTLFLLLCLMALTMSGCGKQEKEIKASPVHSVDDLTGKKIGVQIGTTGDIYASDYEKDGKGTKIDRYNKGADAVQALKQGKCDCVIIDEQPAKAFVEKNNDLSVLKEEFTVEDYAIGFSKKNTKLQSQVNEALAQMKEDGTLQNIIDHYIDGKGESYVKKEVKRSGKLVMGTNAAFPPYEFYENGKIVGIDAEMAQAVADKLGKELVIEDMEFDSIIAAVQTGKIDMGVAGLTVTEDRLKNVNFSDSYTTSKQVIIVRNGKKASETSFKDKLYNNFVKGDRYQYLLKGLGNTLIITFFAVILGIILGFVIAIIRSTHDKHGTLKIPNLLCKIYLAIVRGTPVMVQVLIIYYVIFASTNVNKVLVGVLAFGLNSAAYVAEIVRGGIMSIDPGQFEAGRSLGLTFPQTMTSIILPQTFKQVLPALGNEFIVLLKETAISGYIGLVDLTKGGVIILSNTYDAMLPLFTVAIIYLVIVLGLTALVNRLERRLRTNER